MEIKTPVSKEKAKSLRIGQEVEVTGKIYTARDAAHERILETKKLPFNLEESIIYHCGPLVKKEDDEWKIVSAGPTTSTRLSKFIPKLLEKHEIRAFIGKGGLDRKVIPVMREKNCVYLSYTGGAAALAAESIEKIKNAYWKDLGMPEAVWELMIHKMPCTVAIDTEGNNLFKSNI